MNKKILTIIVGALIIATVSAGAVLFLFPYNPKHPPKADDSGWTQEGVNKVVNGNNQFAFELYKELSKKEKGNILFSPYSLSSAMAITYEGARGKTREEIKSVFHFPETNILRPNFARIYNDLNSNHKDYELLTGNALWAQKNFPFLKSYMETAEKYYGGKATNLDFCKKPKLSRQTINAFISNQTNGKITNLIPEGILDCLTELVITNAIYFKGTWQYEFDPKNTKERDFKTPNGVVKVPMMCMEPKDTEFNYSDFDKFKMIELPYKGNKISMFILLPKQEKSFDFKTGKYKVYNYTLKDINLSEEKLKEYESKMHKTKLDEICIPKFEFKTKYLLNQELMEMGMPTAFLGSADFSGMDGSHDLYIAYVFHNAYIKVDEKGTEAAAATAVVMTTKSARISKPSFIADHPFIFIIQDKKTGNILFFGKVVDPRNNY